MREHHTTHNHDKATEAVYERSNYDSAFAKVLYRLKESTTIPLSTLVGTRINAKCFITPEIRQDQKTIGSEQQDIHMTFQNMEFLLKYAQDSDAFKSLFPDGSLDAVAQHLTKIESGRSATQEKYHIKITFVPATTNAGIRTNAYIFTVITL